jgi:pimeloyl-ACP methyl ester carboxylesterase
MEQAMELVLLPGMDGTGRMFEPFVHCLPAGLRGSVVRYPADRECSIEELADIARAAIPADRPAIIVAESFSGLVTCELLKHRPANVRGVVFVGAFLAPPRPLLIRALSVLPAGIRQGGRIGRRLIGRACLGRWATAETRALLEGALAEVDPWILASRLRMILQPPAAPPTIDVPTCYLQATGDRLVPARCAATFAALAAELEVIPIDGPHMLLQARPAECWRAIGTSRTIGPVLTGSTTPLLSSPSPMR